MRKLSIRRPLLLAAIAMALVDSSLAAIWYESYQKGKDALAVRDWNAAVRLFDDAIAQQPNPGVGVRTYGMNFIKYFPYLNKGMALYNLGKFEEALKALETEERLGEVAKASEELQNLRAFRKLAQDEMDKSRLGERERIAGIVGKSLEDARVLQDAGRLEDAMAALASGLAADQNNPDLLETMKRLQEETAAKAREQASKARAGEAVQEAKSLLAAGRYQEASRALNQALSLDPKHPEVKGLLEESQEKLLAEIESKQGAEQRLSLVQTSLAEAFSLEKEGQIEGALEKLQSVLALDPSSREALAMQGRLLRSHADAESKKAQETE